MVEIELDTSKTIQQNAAHYFEKGKKAKSKIEGVKETIERYKQELAKIEKEQFKIEEEKTKVRRTPKWYEKFRWFITSEGFLVVGGRDAGSNELVVKKHTDKNDLVFHTEAAGSPFFILKTEGKKPTERSLQEVADATYIFSKSFKAGVGGINSFYVDPDQLSTTPLPGEYLEKGSFIINGKKNVIVPRFNLAIGITEEGAVMCAPTKAVQKHCKKYLELMQSRGEKPSDVAKKIKKKLGGEIDDIIKSLPAGNIDVK